MSIAVGVVVAIWAPEFLSSYMNIATGTLGSAVATGALAGAAGGAIMTGTLQGTLKGAAFGALSAGVANIIGHGNNIFAQIAKKSDIGKAALHGISRAAISKLQNGSGKGGFLGGFASSLLGGVVSGVQNAPTPVKVAMSAIAGGTASVLGGGKFSNGAMSGAFIMMFNELANTYPSRDKIIYVRDRIDLNKEALLKGALMGDLTPDEAIAWYRYGGGTALTIDGNRLSYIRTGLTDDKGNYTAIVTGINDYKVHGQVTIKSSNGHIYDGKYNFEMHNNIIRDFGTVLGHAVAGQGTDCLIQYRY